MKTTDLETIRDYPNRYTWGKVTDIYDVGKYTIIKYIDTPTNTPVYTAYINGKCINCRTATLEEVLVMAVAFDLNSNFNEAVSSARAAMRVLRP